eukprot:11979853-Prorocentrum_lima.AAC.1
MNVIQDPIQYEHGPILMHELIYDRNALKRTNAPGHDNIESERVYYMEPQAVQPILEAFQ